MAQTAVGSIERRHGRQKRRAEDELEGEQPLTKKFGCLNIDQQYSKHADPSSIPKPVATPTILPLSNSTEKQTSLDTHNNGDGMNVDDTKTRVYITDLDNEIAEIEEAEAKKKIEFMPDIEKKLMAIPKSILDHRASSSSTTDTSSSPENQNKHNHEVVLYRVPTALSIPKELDSVRAVVSDSRQRASEKIPESVDSGAGTTLRSVMMDESDAAGLQAGSTGLSLGSDADPMDID